MMRLKLVLLSKLAIILAIFSSVCVLDWQCTRFLYYTNGLDHHRSQLGVRHIIDSFQSLSIEMNADQSTTFSYSPIFMRSLSCTDDQVCKLSSETCKELASLRLLRSPCTQHPTYLYRRILRNKRWRRRGRRGGLRHIRRENQIPVVISSSSPGGGALTFERGIWMCRGHDSLFSGQSPLPSLPIYHQCAALVPPVFNF